ncbi:carbohydrate binding domain-containing protein, partial [Streptomyces sp. NPDC058469]|uniref:carbohydrate binding domain-containing protein n=1 Tax=Streptomyces sp. NPDC058469 TaxID=3346514 RepID=UPI003656E677
MPLLVEAGWGGLVQYPDTITWTDITQYANQVQGVSISRGAADELSETQPGTATLVLDNADGRFTPGNAASPYYPYVRRNAPIRISVVAVTKNFVTNPTFETDTSDWALGSDAATTFAQSSTRAQHGTKSLLITWGGSFNSNPAFETALSPWTGNTATAARVNTQAQSGSWSMQITPNGTSPSPRAESEQFAVTAGNSYRAKGWLRCATSRTVSLNVNWYNSSSSYLSTSTNTQAVTANTWTQFSALFTAPVGAAYGQLAPTVPSTPPVTDVLYVDEVRLLSDPGNEFPAVGTTLYGLDMGQQYTASSYVWVPTGSRPVSLFVVGINGAGASSTTNDAWQRITYTFTATSTSHTLQLIPSGHPQFGTQVWLDAVQVEAGAAATTFDANGAQVRSRFYGRVNEFPVDWEGLVSTVRISCTDLFKLLNRLPTLRSMLTEEIANFLPDAYYALTEPSDSTSAGDLSGNGLPSMAITQVSTGGTLTMGTDTGPDATGDSTPTLTPSTATAGLYLTVDLGAATQQALTNNEFAVEGWFKTTTTGRAILGLYSADLQCVQVVSLSASGALQIEWTASGSSTLTVTTVDGTSGLADGKWHHFEWSQSLSGSVAVDGVVVDASVPVTDGFDQRFLHIGGYRGTRLWSGSLAHVALYARPSIGSVLATHYASGMTGNAGESADTRIARFCTYVGLVDVIIQGSTHDPIASQGPGGTGAVARMREVESTESGKLFAARDQYLMTYQSRDVRYNPSPASDVFTIAYADLETGSTELADDDQKMVNSLEASRPGGATQRVTAPA